MAIIIKKYNLIIIVVVVVCNIPINNICGFYTRSCGRPRVLPEKRRRRRTTRLRGSISCNRCRSRRNASTNAFVVVVAVRSSGVRVTSAHAPPVHRSMVTRGRRANGRAARVTPIRPPPSAIGRPIELFVYPAAVAVALPAREITYGNRPTSPQPNLASHNIITTPARTNIIII